MEAPIKGGFGSAEEGVSSQRESVAYKRAMHNYSYLGWELLSFENQLVEDISKVCISNKSFPSRVCKTLHLIVVLPQVSSSDLPCNQVE